MRPGRSLRRLGIGHQQVSSTRRRWPASETNSGVSRWASRRGIGRVTGTCSRTRPGPRRQQQHALAEERRLVDRVRHEHDGRAGGLPELQQLLVQPVARDLVERAERLVHQQQPRAGDQRAGDRHALAHAARQLVRIGLLPAGQAHQAQQLVRRARTGQRLAAADLQRQRDVVEHACARRAAPDPGTRSRSAAIHARPAARRPSPRRGRWSAPRDRPSPAARSTCRNPTARAASGSCRARS